jgi:CheY-like chemotaxis protein
MNSSPLTLPSDSRFAIDHPLRILIAEDNYINRRLLLLVLRGLGYDPVATENGRECLEAVIAAPDAYDVLLTDVDMPEMDGIECTAYIRQASIDLPVIAITASGPEFSRERCFEAGMNGFMVKPVMPAELKRTLREVCLRKWVDESNLVVVSHHLPAAA